MSSGGAADRDTGSRRFAEAYRLSRFCEASRTGSSLGPPEVLLEERERPFRMDLVPAGEELDRRPLGDAQLAVEAADLGVLVGHHLVGADAVVVAALDHERPRRDQAGHLGVVERVAEI